MIVVSDTSPLNYLVLVEAIHVLPELYDHVCIPHQVLTELGHDRAPRPVRHWADHLPQWVLVRDPAQIDVALRNNRRLDEGEIHAIALAEELKAPLLVDERDAYAAAKTRGLTATGVLGVLDQAADRRLLDLPVVLARLTTETSFRYSQKLIDRLLARDTQRRLAEQ